MSLLEFDGVTQLLMGWWWQRGNRTAELAHTAAAHGPEGIAQIGHRAYVGGLWEEIGGLQFAFLKEQGLQPEQVLLDIACGSLRLGVRPFPTWSRGTT